MIKRAINKVLNRFGYRILRVKSSESNDQPFVLHRYLKKDASFDYEKYVRIQEKGNQSKIHNVWVIEDNIAFIADYLKQHHPSPQFGICHGTRQGKEQEWFRKYLRCEVIGTEISTTAKNFPHTIQWDFHQVKPEWIGAVDFIYSNSFDHSYDPERCLNAWMSCVKRHGLCVIEHSAAHEPKGANELDPFGADLHLMPYLITKWGNGIYGVRQILAAPVVKEEVQKNHFIVIQKF